MFYHENISACAPFGDANVPADGRFNTRTCQHGNFLVQGIFGTRNFWHNGHFGTGILAPEHFAARIFWHLAKQYDVSAQTFRHRCYCAKIAMCQNIPVLKILPAKKSPMSKPCRVETSICQNVRSALWCTCQNDSCQNPRFRNGGKPGNHTHQEKTSHSQFQFLPEKINTLLS